MSRIEHGGIAWVLKWRPVGLVREASYVAYESERSTTSVQEAALFATSKDAISYACEHLGHPECWSIEKVHLQVTEVPRT